MLIKEKQIYKSFILCEIIQLFLQFWKNPYFDDYESLQMKIYLKFIQIWLHTFECFCPSKVHNLENFLEHEMFITFLGRARLHFHEILMGYVCFKIFMDNLFRKINNVSNKELSNIY